MDDLLAVVFKGVLQETGLNPSEIQDVCVGKMCKGICEINYSFIDLL